MVHFHRLRDFPFHPSHSPSSSLLFPILLQQSFSKSQICCLSVSWHHRHRQQQEVQHPIVQIYLFHYWWGCRLVQAPWKSVQRGLRKRKINLPYYPAVPLQGIYSQEIKSAFEKVICNPIFTTAQSTIVKNRNNPNAHQKKNKENCDIFTPWDTTQPFKRIKFYHLQQMVPT